MEANPTTFHHPPSRRPGHKTLARLLVAAEDQLREGDLDAFTIQSVLARTDLSVGAFYSRFPDKTALLHAVQQRLHERLEPRIVAELEAQAEVDETLEEAVDHGFGILLDHVLEERALTRAFMMRSVFDPVLRAKGEQVNVDRRRALTAFLMHHRDEIGHADPERAIGEAYAMYSTVLRGRLVYFDSASEAHSGVTDQSIFSLLKTTLGSYLSGGAPRRPSQGALASRPSDAAQAGVPSL